MDKVIIRFIIWNKKSFGIIPRDFFVICIFLKNKNKLIIGGKCECQMLKFLQKQF